VLVVDDEPLSRLGVTERLRNHEDMELVGECGNGQDALRSIADLHPDLVFLDINMPGLSGLELLKSVPLDQLPCIVFLTAHEEYALDAFEVEALDYLLKPIDDTRFAGCLARARRLIALKQQEHLYEQMRSLVLERTEAKGPQGIREFAVRQGNSVAFVKAMDIDWIEGLGDYAGLHVGTKTHLIRESLTRLEEHLDATGFLRIHRSSIVQVNRIVQVISLSNRDLMVSLRDGTSLRASRSYSVALQELLRNGHRT
jgi:two-component system LytT family response regulator